MALQRHAADDRQILLSEVEDANLCLELIFDQLDWYDYLDAYEMTSAELMAKLPENYRKFYEPHHKQFLADGEFV